MVCVGRFNCQFFVFTLPPAGSGELDRSKWDEDWDKSKGAFPFSEKLGEISDKIGSTIDDTLNKFRKKERDDSPDRTRYLQEHTNMNNTHTEECHTNTYRSNTLARHMQ